MSKEKKRFTDTQGWKNTSNVIINLGAALVIIGALFKIQGWSGASLMLTVGMGVEALIFALGALDTPISLPDWARVYPQLDKNYTGELPTEAVNVGGGSTAPQGMEQPKVDLPDIVGVNEAIAEYIKGIKTASNSFNKIAQISEDSNVPETLLSFDNSMKGSITTLDTFGDRCNNINSATSKFASSQTKQIEAQETYTKGLFNMYSEINKLQDKVKESIDDLTVYNAKNKKLNASITELNSIYGEMLSTSKKTAKNI